jgi:rod shape-determining protein MreB and related proteins
MFKKVLGIDLGTETTQIYLKGKGIVIDEPSIVAFNNRTNRVIAVGKKARAMISRTPSHITAMSPIANGVIADFDMAKEMVRKFLKNKNIPWSLFTDVVVSVPTNLTEVERKSVIDLLKETGVNNVYLLEQPLAAAFSIRLNIFEPTAYLILDIGAGTSDMAIISMNGIVVSKRLKIAGNFFDNEIIKGVKDELKLNIGKPTAKEIKLAVGSAIPRKEKLEVTVRGRDVLSGLPREVDIKDTMVRSKLSQPLKEIVSALKDLIEITPPELVGDIYHNGIYVCGGGSMLRGVEDLLKKEIGVDVHVINEPLTCVARGSGVIAEEFDKYSHLLTDASLKEI